MGAGARLAEERDRWPDYWQVADLEQEEEHLLELLDPAEELQVAVPGRRTTDADGEEQVLIGVTDRRVLVLVRRREADASWTVRVADATTCAATLEHVGIVPFRGGRLELDLDHDALTRLWEKVDGLPSTTTIPEC